MQTTLINEGINKNLETTVQNEMNHNMESFLDINKEDKKVMSKGQKKQWKENVKEVETADQCMWSVLQGKNKGRALPKGCKVFLMEIFAGAAVLSALTLGLEVTNPVDIKHDGSDLLKQEVRDQIEKEIEEKDPYSHSHPCVALGDHGATST